ncbi:MAG: hypothetical protein QW036_05115, partial [Zestosphaera sp.]
GHHTITIAIQTEINAASCAYSSGLKPKISERRSLIGVLTSRKNLILCGSTEAKAIARIKPGKAMKISVNL